MPQELKLIQTIYNLLIDITACLMKIGVILSLPFMFINFLFNHKPKQV